MYPGRHQHLDDQHGQHVFHVHDQYRMYVSSPFVLPDNKRRMHLHVLLSRFRLKQHLPSNQHDHGSQHIQYLDDLSVINDSSVNNDSSAVL
jgi:hypothetical protein